MLVVGFEGATPIVSNVKESVSGDPEFEVDGYRVGQLLGVSEGD